MLLFTAAALAGTLHVGPTQAYQTVQDAVAASSLDDTILIEPGTYDLGGLLYLHDRQTLRGSGPGEVRLVGALYITAGGRLESVTMVGLPHLAGVYVSTDYEVHDTVFEMAVGGQGLFVDLQWDLTVDGCRFVDGDTAITGVMSGETLIHDSRFEGQRRGAIELDIGDMGQDRKVRVTLARNRFEQVGWGASEANGSATDARGVVSLTEVDVTKALDVVLRANRVRGSHVRGVYVSLDEGRLIATNNVLVGNRDSDDVVGAGLTVVSQGGGTVPARVRDNTFFANQAGLSGVGSSLYLGAGVVGDVQNNVFALGTAHAEEPPAAWNYNLTYGLSDNGGLAYSGAASAGPGGVDVAGGEPLFVLPSVLPGRGDFGLLPGSAAIDAGNPAWLDDDGTVSDIGAR